MAVNSANKVVDRNYDTDDRGFILVDARNAFNELNRYTMLWAVRHLWPSGYRFAFNCYCCWIPLDSPLHQRTSWDIFLSLLKDRGHPGVSFLHASLRIPLIRKLNVECKLDRHLWYADNSGAKASFDYLEKYFSKCTVHPMCTHLNHINVS